MNVMVERVAKLIQEIADSHAGNFEEYASDWQAFEPDARNLIQTLRRLDDPVAVVRGSVACGDGSAVMAWETIIDTILRK